jgi:multidrug efflux pump subunit AcrB
MLMTDVYLRFFGVANYLADVTSESHMVAIYAMGVIFVFTLLWAIFESKTGSIHLGYYR